MSIAANLAILGLLATSEPGRGQRMDDGIVRFEVGSDKLEPESLAILARTVSTLQKNPSDDVWLIGHTDPSGTAELNNTLSVRRAEVVKAELVRLGVEPDRIRVQGVGASEPLTTDTSPQGAAQNRRVEVWIGSPNPIAWVSWIQEIVEASPPSADRWQPAELEMALRKLFRVRTAEKSASEVRFDAANRLYVGPRALVVIYGPPGKAKTGPKARTSDVKLEAGTLFARLAEKEKAEGVTVETAGSRVRLKTKKARIDYDAKKRASTLSVYEGKAEVEAQAKQVDVGEGFGTRVKDGQPPEPPTPLADPPVLEGHAKGILAFSDRPLLLAWKSKTASTSVEVASGSDPEFTRSIRTQTFSGSSGSIEGLEPGTYWVRLTAIDERGIAGKLGRGYPLVLAPVFLPNRGVARRTETGFELTQPARVNVAAPEGLTVEIRDPAGVEVSLVRRGGPHVLRFTKNGQTFAEDTLELSLGTLEVRPKKLDVQLERDASITSVEFDVFDRNGAPVRGLNLKAEVAEPVEPGASTQFQEVTCLKGDPVQSSSDGYSARIRSPLPKKPVARSLRLCESELGLSVRAPIPDAPAAPFPDRGPFFEVGGGPELIDPRPAFQLRFGWTMPLGAFRLNLSPEFGFSLGTIQRPAGPEQLSFVPILGRVAFALDGETFRPYLAVAGGFRWFDAPSELGIDALAGAVRGEIGLEWAVAREQSIYLEAGVSPSEEAGDLTFGGPTISVGWRAFLAGIELE